MNVKLKQTLKFFFIFLIDFIFGFTLYQSLTKINKQNVEIILRRDHMQLFLKAYPQKSLYGTSH